jgi:hypothetical protein
VRQGGARGHEAGVGDMSEVKRNDRAHRARQSTAAAFGQRETTVRGQTGVVDTGDGVRQELHGGMVLVVGSEGSIQA